MRHQPTPSQSAASVSTDLFRNRLDAQIDLRHSLCKLAAVMPWDAMAKRLSQVLPASPSAGGRPALSLRLMCGLLYLKHAYDLSDEALCERWLENPYWQFFCGEVFFQTRFPCDPSSLTRFRKRLGEAGVEELLAQSIEAAKQLNAVKPADLLRVIVDTTVQEKAVAYPTDSRLLEVARKKLVLLARRCGITLRQSYEREGPTLRRRAAGYAHAKQFKRLRRILKRQRTLLGRLLRDVQRKAGDEQKAKLSPWLTRIAQLQRQKPKDKNKLYALHAPEVECIGKGKARNPYEFGVKVGLAVTAKQGLIVGARSFAGNPYDGDTLAEQIEQVSILTDCTPKQVIVDLGFRGRAIEGIDILHRGLKQLTRSQKRWLKRRQSIEPIIGHAKDDCRMRRCHLKGAIGDAMHAVLCAAGYNLRWLMRWIASLLPTILGMLVRTLHQKPELCRHENPYLANWMPVPT
jgi:transposase, IS5 family